MGKASNIYLHLLTLADLHTKFSGARPLRDPIILFSHTFSLKRTRNEVHAPQTSPRPPREILDPLLTQYLAKMLPLHLTAS